MRAYNIIPVIPELVLNWANDTDSYKFSHFELYPFGMEYMESYFESRGGEFDQCTLFGLQYVMHRYLCKILTVADVDELEQEAAYHGEPFNRKGFMHIINKYDGKLPIQIRAIPEGMKVPTGTALMVVRSPRDKRCAWITNWLETMLSRVWYTSTIAIAGVELMKVWLEFLELSSDAPDIKAEALFKHHDFGSRGVTCREQAMLGGMSHLLTFRGSDTFAGIKGLMHYYRDPTKQDIQMPGFSIPATEHSTMTIHGRNGERAALIKWIKRTLIERTLPPGVPKLAACVADSYQVYDFARMVCEPKIIELIRNSGGTLVVRPDSGDPCEVLKALFDIFEQCLPVGSIRVNAKGYKVLPDYLRLIYGDGINRQSMRTILKGITDHGWSASNLAMGSGGGLLQSVNRDTQKFAFKCCYAIVDGESVDVRKDPITDKSKRSKAGHLDTVRMPDGAIKTIAIDPKMEEHHDTVMNFVFDTGNILFHNTAEEVRARLAA